MTKHFAASKINWLGILMVLAALADYKDMLPAEWVKPILVVSGVAVVILRTFYTDTAIETGKKG